MQAELVGVAEVELEQVDGHEDQEHEGIAVEAGESDELPAEAQLGQVPDQGLHLCVGRAGRVPVEGRAGVVGQRLVGPGSMDLLRKLGGLGEDRLVGLHP